MFGANPIRGRETDPSSLAITEIFYTLQGEGPFSGSPALFIRLAGCNLACTFCDTEFEKGIDRPHDMREVANMLAAFSPRQRQFVVITGGEPLRQAGAAALCRGLYMMGTEHIQFETAGTLWVNGLEDWLLDGRMTLVCSPKTPKVHPEVARFCYDWKYIIRTSDIRSELDGLPISGTQAATIGKYQILARPPKRDENDFQDTVWVSPCDEHDEERSKANVVLARDLALEYGYRLNLQIHKLVGVA